ncbi:hypothetical protein GCM10017673_50000 [Streptosporangium violaceochromogenes]|nr:hypothetical protein GCM10017673_50000 [Streptosporangium violaceochromogenes]
MPVEITRGRDEEACLDVPGALVFGALLAFAVSGAAVADGPPVAWGVETGPVVLPAEVDGLAGPASVTAVYGSAAPGVAAGPVGEPAPGGEGEVAPEEPEAPGALPSWEPPADGGAPSSPAAAGVHGGPSPPESAQTPAEIATAAPAVSAASRLPRAGPRREAGRGEEERGGGECRPKGNHGPRSEAGRGEGLRAPEATEARPGPLVAGPGRFPRDVGRPYATKRR